MSDEMVMIVGGGPVGVLTALALSRRGIPVTVLEAEDGPNLSPRAIVYLHPLLPDLDALGILTDMRERGHIDHEGFNMHLVELDEVLSAPNTLLEGISPTPYNVHMGQGELVTLVLEHLARAPRVHVRFGTKVVGLAQDDSGVTLTVEHDGETSTLRSGWVVGADGARSAVRELIGGTLEGFTWGERFVAANIRYDFRSLGMRSSNLYVHPTHAAVIAQINQHDLWRCTFQEDLDLPEEGVEGRIDVFLRGLLGEQAAFEVVGYRPYRMHQRLSTTLHEGRVVLAGDAAHITNPTGGLGLTTGIYDALALAEVLPAVIEGRADQEVLDRYAADRSRVFNEITSPLASQLKQLVYGRLPADELRAATEDLRHATSTRESQIQMLLGLDAPRSPSLLDSTSEASR